MEVLDFMNLHDNWEEILTQPPYNVKVSRDNGYILLKYNQLNSDFTIPIVRECRGAIFWQNENGKYECVCRAFDKFGNYGEAYVPEIDWSSAVVEEKVDGSLIKVWHVSTNGTIDAYKAEVDDMGLTFGDLFEEAMLIDKYVFLNALNTNSTYMFELVSPKSRVTISYPCTKLYYLGSRDMQSMQEFKVYDAEHMWINGIDYPNIFPLHTLEDCLKYVVTMTRDEEGFVVRDKNFNRMKIKSPEYLIAAQLRNNGAITTKRIIRMMQNNTIDDFMAYCPAYQDRAQKVIDTIYSIASMLEDEWKKYYERAFDNRKTFAALVQQSPYKSFLFAKLQNTNLAGIEYIMDRPVKQIKNMIERYENNGN